MVTFRKIPAIMRGVVLGTAFSAVAQSAQAENSVVVELYTSQGCSSCPPADEVLKTLNRQENIIALSLNVDYWDYLGWEDDLALPGNTLRQRSYAKMMRSRHVYTPQLMVDGRMDVIGSRRPQVDAAIEAYSQLRDEAKVTAEIANDTVNVSVSPNGRKTRAAVVWLVGYDASVVKNIGGGENNGRSIEYSNVVREWRELGRWDGSASSTFEGSKPKGKGGFAVIVQEGDVGEILGATQVRYGGSIKAAGASQN